MAMVKTPMKHNFASQTIAPILALFDSKPPLCLAGDALAYGIGVVISHRYPNSKERSGG